jgi:hypothetical protein
LNQRRREIRVVSGRPKLTLDVGGGADLKLPSARRRETDENRKRAAFFFAPGGNRMRCVGLLLMLATMLPQSVYDELAGCNGVPNTVTLPQGRFTLPLPLEWHVSNVTLSQHPLGTTIVYPELTSAGIVGISVYSEPIPFGKQRNNMSRLVGIVNPDTVSLTMDEVVDVRPGEMVELELGIDLFDCAEAFIMKYAKVASVNGSTITFTKPLGVKVPVYKSVQDVLDKMADQNDAYKIGEPWGDWNGSGNVFRSTGQYHGMRRFNGGLVTGTTINSPTFDFADPGQFPDPANMPNGGACISVVDTEGTVVNGVKIVNGHCNPIFCWRNRNVTFNGVDVGGRLFVRFGSDPATSRRGVANIFTLWAGDGFRVNDLSVATVNSNVITAERGPRSVIFDRGNLDVSFDPVDATSYPNGGIQFLGITGGDVRDFHVKGIGAPGKVVTNTSAGIRFHNLTVDVLPSGSFDFSYFDFSGSLSFVGKRFGEPRKRTDTFNVAVDATYKPFMPPEGILQAMRFRVLDFGEAYEVSDFKNDYTAAAQDCAWVTVINEDWFMFQPGMTYAGYRKAGVMRFRYPANATKAAKIEVEITYLPVVDGWSS